MKKLLVVMMMVMAGTLAPIQKVSAQDPISEVIRQALIKVIKAVDLQIQRFQTETIWLQNAQKVVENKMSELKLTEIGDWAEKQRTLYADYFDELWKVKNVVAYYHKIKEVSAKQVSMVNEYKHAYNLFKQDSHFTVEEIGYMGKVYTGIIEESLKSLDQLFLVINSFTTQMSDAKRLAIIDAAASEMDKAYNDLKAFNNENKLLSLQRSKSLQDAEAIKTLYGLK